MAPPKLRPQVEGQLEAKSGECAKIESSTRHAKTTYKIVPKHLRGKGSKVSLWTLPKEDRNVYLAFCFELNDQKYFAAANTETSKIQVEQLNKLNEVDSKFLFRWGNPYREDEWNNLCSVAEPSKYLTVSGNAFTLSTSQEYLFKFTCKKDEKGMIGDSHNFRGKCKVKARRMVKNRLSR